MFTVSNITHGKLFVALLGIARPCGSPGVKAFACHAVGPGSIPHMPVLVSLAVIFLSKPKSFTHESGATVHDLLPVFTAEYTVMFVIGILHYASDCQGAPSQIPLSNY